MISTFSLSLSRLLPHWNGYRTETIFIYTIKERFVQGHMCVFYPYLKKVILILISICIYFLLQICAVLVFYISSTEEKVVRVKRSQHVPPLDAPTFRRDSVEHAPVFDQYVDRSYYTVYEEFGSKSLPLRAAVESIPNMWVILIIF